MELTAPPLNPLKANLFKSRQSTKSWGTSLPNSRFFRLFRYSPPHDRSNLGSCETPRNSDNLTGRGITNWNVFAFLRFFDKCSSPLNAIVYALFLIVIFPLFSNSIQLHGPQLSFDLMQDLKNRFNIEVLVETGTWGGETARNASSIFKEVYTVELSHDLFQQAKDKLMYLPNVRSFEGDSPLFLKRVIPKIHGRILFWLDAHWCGDNTARAEMNTPIRNELLAIQESGLNTAIILIDDIRCFHNLPEEIAGYGGYPLLDEIKALVFSINPNYEFWILGDMAIAFLKEDRQEVSPLVQACTASRLFKDSDDSMIIEIENALIQHCNDPDSSAIDFLQCLVIPSTEFIAYHLALWKGLVEFGRKNFDWAVRSFEQVLSGGYQHWRVYWYLARAEQAQGHTERANELFAMAKQLRNPSE